jgi:hypothetical protein
MVSRTWSRPQIQRAQRWMPMRNPPCALFAAACERDFEGIVAKWSPGRYQTGSGTSWLKIKNASYSQIEGRHDCSNPEGALSVHPRVPRGAPAGRPLRVSTIRNDDASVDITMGVTGANKRGSSRS